MVHNHKDEDGENFHYICRSCCSEFKYVLLCELQYKDFNCFFNGQSSEVADSYELLQSACDINLKGSDIFQWLWYCVTVNWLVIIRLVLTYGS